MKRNNTNSRRTARAPGRGRTAGNGNGDGALMHITHPPQLNGIELRHSVAIRFVTNAAVSQSITFQNLLDTILFASSATAPFDVFQAVKVRRVRIWAVPILGQATSVSVEYGGVTAGIVGDQVIHTDTSMGIQPAHIDARPSPKCLCSNYQVSSGSSAFSLTCPSGSVVDVEMSYRAQYAVAIAAQNASVGATTGAIYLRGLDGLALATTKFLTEFPTQI